jgi:hypothetical protein
VSGALIIMSSAVSWAGPKNATDACRYVDRVLALDIVRRIARVLTTEACVAKIYACGGLPRENLVRSALRGTDFEVLDVSDIIRVLVAVLDTAMCAEREVGDALFRDIRVVCNGVAEGQVDLDQVAGAVWWAQETSNACSIVVDSCDVGAHCTVSAFVDMADRREVPAPLALSQGLAAVDSRRTLMGTLDLEAAWGQAKGPREVNALLPVMNEVWRKATGVRTEVVLGHRFLPTAQKYGFCHEPGKMSRLMVRLKALVEGTAEGRGHPLREGKAPSEATVMDGSWEARRYDIDYEWHLHVWQCYAGTVRRIELANLGPHTEDSIYSQSTWRG